MQVESPDGFRRSRANRDDCAPNAIHADQAGVASRASEAPRGWVQALRRSALVSRLPAATALFLGAAALRLLVLWMLAVPQGWEGLAGLLSKWDGEIYLDIARYGYFPANGGENDPGLYYKRLAFFPAFPGLIRALTAMFGLSPVAAGLIIATLAGIVATAGIMELGSRCAPGASGPGSSSPDTSSPATSGLPAALLLLGAPMSLTLTMVYTEALFLALTLWALVMLLDRRWWQAALLVGLAGLVRLTAIDLILVFVLLALVRRSWRALVWAVASSVPMLTFLAWASWVTRDLGGYFALQKKGWRSGFDFGRASLSWLPESFASPMSPGYVLTTAVMVAALLAVPLAAGFATFRRFPWVIWGFGAALVANVLLSDGIMHSRPRLLLPAILLLLPVSTWIAQRFPQGGAGAVAAGWLLLGALTSAYMVGVFPWAI